MNTEHRISRLEQALGATDMPPHTAMVITNHPDLPEHSAECEDYIASRIPETVRTVFYMADNGRDPDLLLKGPVRLL